MSTPSTADANKSPQPDHIKDACKYSVEVAKHFISLGSAGVAFVLALTLAPNPGARPALGLIHLLPFGLTVMFGLGYVMSIVGHIQQDQNYDVYSRQLRWTAALQIGSFAVGLLVLAFSLKHDPAPASRQGIDPSTPLLIVKTDNNETRQNLPMNVPFELTVDVGGAVTLKVLPVPAATASAPDPPPATAPVREPPPTNSNG